MFLHCFTLKQHYRKNTHNTNKKLHDFDQDDTSYIECSHEALKVFFLKPLQHYLLEEMKKSNFNNFKCIFPLKCCRLGAHDLTRKLLSLLITRIIKYFYFHLFSKNNKKQLDLYWKQLS